MYISYELAFLKNLEEWNGTPSLFAFFPSFSQKRHLLVSLNILLVFFKILKSLIVSSIFSLERIELSLANIEDHRSSRAREFHPHPLTEPCVKVSPHTALHTQLFVHRHNLGV